MAARDIIPKDETERLPWLNNLSVKFGVYATALGFVAADVTALQNDVAMYTFLVNGVDVFKAEAKERVAYKKVLADGPLGVVAPAVPSVPAIAPPATIVAPGIIPRIRALIQRIKRHPAYTKAMGQDMGIEIAAITPAVNPKPTLSCMPRPNGEIEVKFKKGTFTGVLLEGQRASETAWTQIAVSLRSPYRDRRALLVPGQPEVRRIRARYFSGDPANPIGEWSDVVVVTATP